MKKYSVFCLIAAMGLLAGCVKENAPETAPNAVSSLEVSLDPVKTHMAAADAGARKVYWSNGDAIAVNGSMSDALAGLGSTAATASFHFNDPVSAPFNIFYPASAYEDATHVTLPATQTYKADGFADGFFPMAGYSADGSSIALHHLCAVIEVDIKRSDAPGADEDNIRSVTFQGKNNEQVSGSFTIDYANAALTGASAEDADKEVRVVKTCATATDAAVSYFLVVPSQNFTAGFRLVVADENSHTMTLNVGAMELVAGKLYQLSEVTWAPNGDSSIEIATAQDLIDFATAYNAKAYDGVDPLVVNVVADLVFDATSSADFNATGGIGLKAGFGDAEDYYFNGTFNGNNHSISGLEATAPIFRATGSFGYIDGLTILDDCSFTFTHPNTGDFFFGSLVGYHKGELTNVDVAANVSLAAGSVSKITAVGGLVGRMTTGLVEDCTYSGDFLVPDTYAVTEKKGTYFGGLVGYISNSDGRIKDSFFAGTMDVAATLVSTEKYTPYLCIGGIVGSVSAGTVSGCTAQATRTKTITMDNNKSYTATIQNHTRKAYALAQGGIAGQNVGTVSDCVNNASVKNFVLATGASGGTTSDSNSRYYEVGGIVGCNQEGATVSGCTNNGPLESRSTPRIQMIGGVAGWNKGTLSSCSNASTGTIFLTTTNSSPYSVRSGSVGGIVGNNEGGTLSDVQNAGDISLDRTENNELVELRFGGVAGASSTAIDGGGTKNISNAGNILISYNGTTVTTPGLRLGGVIGNAEASVQNVRNSGSVTYQLSSANVVSKLYMGGVVGSVKNTENVTVSGCENSGEVYFNVNGKAAAHSGDYIGGIIGYTVGTDVTTTVSDCQNSGYVHLNCNIDTAVNDIVVSGIVGKMDESGSLTNCSNVGGEGDAGRVYLNFGAAAHTDVYVAGVLGYSSADVSLSGCSNSGYIGNNNYSAANTASYVGGLVGYLSGVSSITSCTNSGRVHNNQSNNSDVETAPFCGGIAAHVVGTDTDHVTITDCHNTSTIMHARRGYLGGIVGYAQYLDMSGCTLNQDMHTTASYTNLCRWIGGLVGWAVNSTITNCSFSGTLLQATQLHQNANSGGGIAAKLEGCTIDGCYSYLTDLNNASTNTTGGAIVGRSISGNTIQNCHYKPEINSAASSIAGVGSFTDGGGNVADL